MAFDRKIIMQIIEEKLAQRRQRLVVWVLAFVSTLFVAWAFFSLYLSAPLNFPVKTIVTVEEKAGLNEIAQSLYNQKIIRSPFWFRIAVITGAGQTGVQAGDYFFDKQAGVLSVAWRLTHGSFGLTPVKITFPEGITNSQMSVILNRELLNFNSKEFLSQASKTEGYNFPDTYLFQPNVKPKEVLETMFTNFNIKIKSIDFDLTAFKKPIQDVVIMASIIEAEARTMETRKIVAGILWKRLSIGMPLQVDAPFQYIIGKNTFQLTTKDLKFDSPYNTYLYKGLPPGAIGNPGLDSIIATINPIKTQYLYYLSDVRGNMHYGKTYAEHLVNKEKYLK